MDIWCERERRVEEQSHEPQNNRKGGESTAPHKWH